MITKYKISISVDEQTLALVRDGIRQGKFRNRSHAFEQAVQTIMEAPSNEP